MNESVSNSELTDVTSEGNSFYTQQESVTERMIRLSRATEFDMESISDASSINSELLELRISAKRNQLLSNISLIRRLANLPKAL